MTPTQDDSIRTTEGNEAATEGTGARRRFITQAAVAGATIATALRAPAVLAQSKAPIRIGVLNAFSGVVAPSAETNWNGMQLYFDSIGGSIAGRKIELIREDDQLNPQVGLQKARKLVDSDKVDLICGPQASNVAMALLNYIKQTKTFLVVSGAGIDPITWERIPYMFRTSLSVWQLTQPMSEWMVKNAGREIVLTASDYAGGRDVLRSFRDAYVARGGKVLKEIYPPLGSADFSVYLTEIRSMNPPAVYGFFPGTDSVRFVQQFAEQGLKGKIRLAGFAGLVDPATFEGQGKSALGVITSTHYTDTLDTPENRQFVADYRARFKAYPDSYSDYGYTAARVIAEAIKAADGDTSNKDRLAEAMSKVNFTAPRGPFRFDPVTHNPIQNIYVTEAVEVGGRMQNKVIDTYREVRDPGVKPA
jgi:branched-chain amino acid transport system substrate-binding protein